MSLSVIKNSKDLHDLLDKNAGITGEVYDNLKDLVTVGEQKMYQEQKGNLSVFKELEEIVKEINRHGQTCAIDYDEAKNKFTIIMMDKENASISDIEQARKNYNKKGNTNYSEATFDIVDASGMNYGKKVNQPMVLYDAKASGGTGRAIMVPRAAAEIRETRIRIQKAYADNKHKIVGLKKGILESAKSGARIKIDEVFNEKSVGALSDYNDEVTVAGEGKEFAVENFAKSRQIIVTQLLKALKYINKVDDYYDNLMWLMTARIAQAKDREKEIELIKKDPSFKNITFNKGFDSMAQTIKKWAIDYHAENIDWREVNENSVATGNLGAFSSATDVARSGNRAKEARNQSKQQLLHKAKNRSVFKNSIYRSSPAEEAAGINRGRSVKKGEYVPFDAFVMGLEVNPLDERVAKTHTLADNIGVSSRLLKQIAGERRVSSVITKEDADKKLNKIFKKLLKNKKRKYSDADGYVTHVGKGAQGKLFRELVGDAKSFQDLPPELQKIVLTEAWRNDISKRGRDVRLSDEKANNISIETNGGAYIIRGTELVRPRQADKLLGQGANIKGSAEIMDDSIKQFGKQYHFLVAQKTGDVRKFGANYVDPDLNSLLIEYGSEVGLHNNKGGLKTLKQFLGNVANNINKEESQGTINAAKSILKAYEFTNDGGVIVRKEIMDTLQELKPEEQTEALRELLPLIDRLINGIDKNNNLMSRKKFESSSDDMRYYKRGLDEKGNEILLRTNKEKRVFANIHRADEYNWKGANMYTGRESLRRSAGLASSEKTRTQEEKDILREGVEGLYKKIDVSEEKKAKFERLKTDAEEAIRLTNKSQNGIKSGLQDNGDYVVLITKNADPSNDSLIDIGSITSPEYEDGVLINSNDILQGVIKNKLEELVSKGINTSKIHFGIDAGTSFGGVVGNKTYGGKVYFLPQNMSLDYKTGFEAYGVEAQKFINLLNSVEDIDPEIIAEKAMDLMTLTLQDFQNKGSVYEKYFMNKTKDVEAGKILPISTQWLANSFLKGNAAQNLSKLEKWQGEVATSGAFISKNMFERSAKKAEKKELLSLYEDFYGGTSLYDSKIQNAKKADIIKAIEKAITYSEDNDSIFMQLLEAGKLESGITSLFSRFPFSNGLDIKNIRKVFIDKNLGVNGEKSNTMRLGFGLANSFNADYDGDIAEILLGTKFTKTEKAASKIISESEEKISKKLAYFAYKDMVEDAGYKLNEQNQYVKNNGVTVLDAKTLQNIFDSNLHIVAATGVRYGKQNTGKLSNIATEFRNMLNARGFDESALLNSDTAETRKNAANAMIGRAFLEQMEQDAISSKKNIERMIKVKSGKDASTMSDEELYESYTAVIEDVDSILENFYTKKLDFSWLTKKLSEIGVLESDGSLKSGRVLRQYLEHIRLMEGGEDILSQIFGVDKNQINFIDENAENYYLNKSISSSQMKKVFSNIANILGESSVNSLFNALPKKEYTPEKKIIKPFNLATEDIKNADKVWLEHVKTLNSAEEASVSEANAESNKIGIAFKEAKAIEHLSDAYSSLSTKLEETQGNYKALNRISTTELKNRLLPYDKENTTGLDNVILNKFYEDIQNGANPPSKQELLEKFGVKDEKFLNTLFYNNLSTSRGNYIHKIAQGDKNGAKEAEEKILKLLKVFGFSEEQIKTSFKIYEQAAQNIKEITNSFGTSLGSELPLIGMTNNGQYVVNGITDNIFVKDRPNKFDSSKNERVMTIVDYKSHKNGELENSDIVQGIAYKSFLEDMKTYITTEGSLLSFEDAAEKIKHDIDWGNKWTPDKTQRQELLSKVTPDFLKELKLSDVIKTVIVVTDPSTAESQAYLIGSERDKYNQIRDRILSGDTSVLTPEEKILLKSNAKTMTDATHYRRGVDPSKMQGVEQIAAQENVKKRDTSDLKEYLKLLDQQYEIQLKINKLKHEKAYLEAQGESLTDVENKIAEEQKYKRRVDRLMKGIEKDGFDETAQKEIDQKKSIKDIELKHKSEQFGSSANGSRQSFITDDQIRAEDEYEKSLNKVLKIQKQIYAVKHQIDVSTGQEKTKNEELLQILQQQFIKQTANAKAIGDSGLVRDDNKSNILTQFQFDLEQIAAQENVKKRGAGNLFDVISANISRAMMRITDYGLAVKVLNAVPQSVQKVKQLTIQLEEALMNLRVVAELNREEGESLILTYSKMGKELGESTTGIAASANEWLDKCVWVTINSFNCWNSLRAI